MVRSAATSRLTRSEPRRTPSDARTRLAMRRLVMMRAVKRAMARLGQRVVSPIFTTKVRQLL